MKNENNMALHKFSFIISSNFERYKVENTWIKTELSVPKALVHNTEFVLESKNAGLKLYYCVDSLLSLTQNRVWVNSKQE